MIVVATLVALLAIGGALRLLALRIRAPVLPPPLAPAEPVTVLLPVRDEQENVEACLAALLAQTIPIRVRVLDDGSTDRTAELVDRIAAADRRVRRFEVQPPAVGRSGKVNALATGSDDLASGAADWLLSIDADARPAPDAIGRALAAADRHGLDAVSLAARQRTCNAAEALLTPAVFALLDALLGDWGRVARGEGAPVANGQFFLIRTRALAAIGGFASIAGEPLDDVALARKLAAGGHRVGFWRAREALEVRMYRGFAASFAGWRRNLALILGDRPATILVAVAIAIAPVVTAISAIVLGRPGAALLAWAGGAVASILLRLGSGSPPLYGVLFPLDGLALGACLLAARSDRSRGRLARWRGRDLDPGQSAG